MNIPTFHFILVSLRQWRKWSVGGPTVISEVTQLVKGVQDRALSEERNQVRRTHHKY
jgi:hypothetical protein